MDLSCFDLPNDALAKKLKNDLFDKLIACTSEEDVQNKLVELVREKVDSGAIDPEKIRTLDSVSDAVTLLYACSIEEQLPNFPDTELSISNALQETVTLLCNLPHFDIPEVSFKFPNLHEGIVEALINSLLQFAIQLITSLMNELLEIIIDFCNNGASALTFGVANLVDILERSAKGIAQNLDLFLETVFGLFGINTDGTVAQIEQLNPDICAEDQITNSGKNVKNFLNDTSTVLTPSELCSLINGIATNETIEIIKELIEFEYPQFTTILNTNDRIISLFSTLGRIVNPNICEVLENTARRPDYCVSSEAEKIRESFLRRKEGVDDLPLTNDQIKIELDKERKRNKDRYERVAETVIAIKKSPNSIFEKAEKSLFCSNGKKGIFTMKMAPVLSYSAKKVINKTFGSVQTNFTKESNNYSTLFIKNERNVDVRLVDGVNQIQTIPKYTNIRINGVLAKNVLNPEFIQATSVYQPVYCDILGRTDFESLVDYGYQTSEEDGDETIDINATEADKSDRKKIRIIKYNNSSFLASKSESYINSIESKINQNFIDNSINLIYNTIEDQQKRIIIKMEQ
jgi:hypothetical protein